MAIANQSLSDTLSLPLFDTTGDRAVTAIYFYNSHTSTVKIDVHVVPFGSTPGPANKILGSLAITSGDTYIIDSEKLILGDGDGIYCASDTPGVVIATTSYLSM